MALTYPEFHALFVTPPIVLLAGLTACRYYGRDVAWRVWTGVFLVVAALAVGYTTPWDNFLIGRGVWEYGSGRVAARILRAPVSEYLFFLLQPALTALWLAQLPGGVVPGVEQDTRDRLLGGMAGLAVGLAGLALATTGSGFYLGAILAWAGPVFALQWAVGWRYLWRVRGRVVAAVAAPTAYLVAIDGVAIARGVWVISDRFTVGLAVAGVPIEEVTFFLVTNLFVVQGLVLFPWVVEQWQPAVVEQWQPTVVEQLRPAIVERWR